MDSTDPRTARTDRKIRAGGLKLLREAGPGKVTIEAVAALTGVAKTSIYRRYNNSTELLEGILEHVQVTVPAVLDEDNWEHSLTIALEALLQDIGQGVVLTLLQEPESVTAEVLRRKVVSPRVDILRDLLIRHMRRGRIREVPDPDVLLDLILGASYAHVARYGGLDDTWPTRMHTTLSALLPGSDTSGSGSEPS